MYVFIRKQNQKNFHHMYVTDNIASEYTNSLVVTRVRFLQVFDWDYITSNDEIGEVQVINVSPFVTNTEINPFELYK